MKKKTYNITSSELRKIIQEEISRDVPNFEIETITRQYVENIKQMMKKWNQVNYIPDPITRQQEQEATSEMLKMFENELFVLLDSYGFNIARNENHLTMLKI